jgi:hypothetical protein
VVIRKTIGAPQQLVVVSSELSSTWEAVKIESEHAKLNNLHC